ncbi:MAG: phosphatidylserine decarboxylase [Nanoarchaeota archaeon]|nr:phosphatidylserine decarboxylase [Nanoarchaeota archaeon]
MANGKISQSQKIPAFLQQYRINTDESEHPPEHYASFNAFFTRRLKSNARPFSPDPEIFCSPADGKVLVYPDLTPDTAIPVKGGTVALTDLLNTDHHPYTGGSALIVRLAPYDYHRFHFPIQGTAGRASTIPGRYYVVNPLSLARLPDLFGRNKRALTEITTEHFGTIAYLEIGGFAVASIVQTYTPGPIDRGQEKGYFQFGGSTLILLFEPGTIAFDSDLIQDSEQDIEVQVQAGTQIGTRP